MNYAILAAADAAAQQEGDAFLGLIFICSVIFGLWWLFGGSKRKESWNAVTKAWKD